ncbi:hypothetical protein ANN_24111 [Periplaneta americana]|uniref:Uncharacterized protein n=1 Tax=Periplaneta americana TaxID=6978 RepID=A0ABQ8S278_PERAM|nr:hypothetical protein ANN_24111 [Periplaneta americana]
MKWPPPSPEFTHCEFWLLGMLKDRVYATDLRERITDVIVVIPQEMCIQALHTTWERFLANGKHDSEEEEKF